MNQFYLRYLLIYLFAFLLGSAQAQQLIDVAGSGLATYSGDGGPALNASLNSPSSLLVTKNKELWIADIDNHRIRVINLSTGIIKTVAGTGVPSFSGDGGPALGAGLNQPRDLFQDINGNIFFTDFGNRRVRKIDTLGTITTVLGNGTTGFLEGANAMATGYPDGASLTVDPQGNIYITDYILRKILRMDHSTKTVHTFAGNGSSVYSGDGGRAIDAGIPRPHVVRYYADNSILVSDINANVVRKISLTTGIIETIAGNGTPGYSGDGGPAKLAQINIPLDLNVDSAGNVYIADGDNHVIRKLDAATGLISTIAGTGEPGYDGANVFFKCSRINVPVSVVWSPDGIIYIGELEGLRIRKLDPSPVMPRPLAVSISRLPPVICPGATLNLQVTRLGGFAGDPQIEWYLNGRRTGYFGEDFSLISPRNGDVVSLMVTGQNNTCQTDSVGASLPPLMLSNDVPATADILGDSILCPQEKTVFTAQSNYRLKNINWTINNVTSGQGPSFSPGSLGNRSVIQFRGSVDSAGCLSGTQVISRPMTIELLPAPALILSPTDTSIMWGNSLTLRAASDPGVTQFIWAGAGVSGNTTSTQTIQPERTGTYTVKVTNSLGCSSSAEAKIRVVRPIFIPNSFTPNADGKNDQFRIPSGTDLELVALRVFNRFGEIVWSTTDPSQGWDGTVNGQLAPVGTYIYQIRYRQDKDVVERKGTVTLIR